MGTGGDPEKEMYRDDTPEVNEIVQPHIVELTNKNDSDGITLEQATHLQEHNMTAENSDSFINNYILIDDIGNLNFVELFK